MNEIKAKAFELALMYLGPMGRIAPTVNAGGRQGMPHDEMIRMQVEPVAAIFERLIT